MGKIVALANQKGGVGKTTTSINLAASLAVLEKRVLLIDADPQANATSGLGFEQSVNNIYSVLLGQCSVEEAIFESNDLPGLFVMPSSINLVGAEAELPQIENGQFRMREALAEIKNSFDYILIDCQPSLGLITLNALTAADSVLIPVQTEYFALEGLGKLLSTIKMIKGKLNENLEIEGFLFTMYDSRLRLANQVVMDVRAHFKDMVYNTIVGRNTRLSEAPSFGKPAILYDASSSGSINYMNLANEFLQRNAF
ncbi:MAG: AAA family ATPase [Rikenellaceae bacterium]